MLSQYLSDLYWLLKGFSSTLSSFFLLVYRRVSCIFTARVPQTGFSSRPDTLTPTQNYNSHAWTWQDVRFFVLSSFIPSLVPWKSSDQCRAQSPSTLHQPVGAYSVQLHKSHCNLCHVIIGFRSPPLSRTSHVNGNIWCGRKMKNSLQCLWWATSRIYSPRQSLLSVIICKQLDLLLLPVLKYSSL